MSRKYQMIVERKSGLEHCIPGLKLAKQIHLTHQIPIFFCTKIFVGCTDIFVGELVVYDEINF